MNSERAVNERLNTLEHSLPILIKKIQDYDKFLSEITNVKTEIENLKLSNLITKENLADHKTFSNNTHLYVQKLNSVIDKNENIHIEKTSSILKQLNDINNCFIELNLSIEKLQSNVFKNEQSLKDVQKNIDENLAILKEKNDNLLSVVKQISNDGYQQKCLQQTQYEEYKKKYTKHEYDISLLSEAIKNVEDKQKSSVALINAIPEANGDFVKRKIDDLSKDIDKKLSNFKLEIQEFPKSAESIKKDISTQLESVGLDSRNAFLKMSNSAQQIVILEKKIENIYLLLKKHELNL